MGLEGAIFNGPVAVGGGLTLIGPLSMDHGWWRKRWEHWRNLEHLWRANAL